MPLKTKISGFPVFYRSQTGIFGWGLRLQILFGSVQKSLNELRSGQQTQGARFHALFIETVDRSNKRSRITSKPRIQAFSFQFYPNGEFKDLAGSPDPARIEIAQCSFEKLV